MEENLHQQPVPVSEPAPTPTAGSTPPPPAPEITIRTMESDVKAIEQGGGEMSNPQPFVPESRTETPKTEANLNVPGYVGPEKPIFSSNDIGVVQPAPVIKETSQARSSLGKTILIIVIVLVVAVAFGLLGYFVISGWIFPKQMPVVQ